MLNSVSMDTPNARVGLSIFAMNDQDLPIISANASLISGRVEWGETMNREVIFEKRYPKAINDTLMAAMVKDLTGGPERREARLSRALAGRVLVPLPQWKKSAEVFIQTAREVSELYELDIKVVKHFDHITVTYYFNAGGGLRHLRDVIRYADELSSSPTPWDTRST